jgi:HAD superfamily hydrolase (TIGR01509 family)
MKQLTNWRAVIFDLDGVLWDSSEIHAAAFQSVLSPLGIDVGLYAAIAGRRTRDVIREKLRTKEQHVDEKLVLKLTNEKQHHALNALRSSPPIDQGVSKVIEKLASSHRLALATSSSRKSLDLFLAASGTRGFFQSILTGEDVAISKPAPAIYQLTLERLGFDAGSAVVVEDADNGIEAALAAKLPVIAFGRAHGRIVDGTRVVAQIEHLSDLLDL